MHKDQLYLKINQNISQIHDDIFPDIAIDEILSHDDKGLTLALEKYTQYFNYTENQEEYNLDYCFKTTLDDLNRFYSFQEERLKVIQEDSSILLLEHKVNQHIYDEVVTCQKKVKRFYFFNMLFSYLLTFLLLFAINQITHLLEINTIVGGTLLALILALAKVLIDKLYLEKVSKSVGWKSYKRAVKRSLAFYFGSIILLIHLGHIKNKDIDETLLLKLKGQVHESIDILLSDIM
ncbi:MAG: hypothetical protein AB7U79_04655 [Candidatus Izemoplasmatales bacterium]